jgi:hypothetical protein
MFFVPFAHSPLGAKRESPIAQIRQGKYLGILNAIFFNSIATSSDRTVLRLRQIIVAV